jgi:hypothetical protein
MELRRAALMLHLFASASASDSSAEGAVGTVLGTYGGAIAKGGGGAAMCGNGGDDDSAGGGGRSHFGLIAIGLLVHTITQP